MTSQGGRANSSGKNAETLINCMLHILKGKGYHPVSQHTFDIQTEYADKLVVDNFVRGIPDFEPGLIFSCKRQETGGSAEQKIEAEIRIIKEYHPYPTILIMVGDAWKPRIKTWVKAQIDGRSLVEVFFRYKEVLSWAESIPQLDPQKAQQAYTDGLGLFEFKRSPNGKVTKAKSIKWGDLPLFGQKKDD